MSRGESSGGKRHTDFGPDDFDSTHVSMDKIKLASTRDMMNHDPEASYATDVRTVYDDQMIEPPNINTRSGWTRLANSPVPMRADVVTTTREVHVHVTDDLGVKR
jgi:hypothetical protein